MKYFTPKRLVQLQDRSNKRRFLAALDAWEDSASAYQRQFDRIKSALPAGLRGLARSVCLHDAQVVDILRAKRNKFTIILQPESDPLRQVVLSYTLAEPAQIVEDLLP